MNKLFDRPIVIQRIDEESEEWRALFEVHARINKTKVNDEFLNAGAIQANETLTFEIRYFAELKEIRRNTQRYRIVYDGIPYDIRDYDDFMLQHKTVKLLGVSY